MAAPNKDALKALRIKAGIVKRLVKEKASYEKEAEQMQQKLEKTRSEGKDEYEIRRDEDMTKETLAVIIDCRTRLRVAYDELKQLVEQYKDLDQEAAEVKAANESLALAAPVVEASA